jgi:hypothetical protein
MQIFIVCSLFVIATVFQALGKVKCNLVLPGTLMPFKKEIAHIFNSENTNFLCKKRFSDAFANIEIQPVYQNRANLKKLVVRTKVV